MGYPELVKALEEETERTAGATLAEAEREATRLLTNATRTASALIDDARAQAWREATAESAEDEAAARLDAERALLVELRALLDRLFAEAEARLRAAPDADLTGRLLESLAAELSGATGTLEVEPAHADLARRLAPSGFTVTPRAIGGGVVARLRHGLVLDDSLPSRLAIARSGLEPQVARLLFGDDHARD